MWIRLIIFFVLNFGALALGGLFTGEGVISDWYLNLNKAPWTPPGWVFGATWTTIMLLFTIYLSILWPKLQNKKQLIFLFGSQWILNVSWNPLFFYFHSVWIALFVIILLTLLILFLIIKYWTQLLHYSWLLAPYFLWLMIATSLNAYVVLNN